MPPLPPPTALITPLLIVIVVPSTLTVPKFCVVATGKGYSTYSKLLQSLTPLPILIFLVSVSIPGSPKARIGLLLVQFCAVSLLKRMVVVITNSLSYNKCISLSTCYLLHQLLLKLSHHFLGFCLHCCTI